MPDAWERWQATGLIDRWAAAEPARCDTIGLVFVDGHWSGAGLPGSVLAATIEAIEARGFMPWRLHRDEDGYAADVTRYPHGFAHTVYGPDKSDSPAEALLTAYLAALEAEAA